MFRESKREGISECISGTLKVASLEDELEEKLVEVVWRCSVLNNGMYRG